MYWKAKRELELLGNKNPIIMELMGVLDRAGWCAWNVSIIKDIFLELVRDKTDFKKKLKAWQKKQIDRMKDQDYELVADNPDMFKKRTKQQLQEAVDDYTEDLLELLSVMERDENPAETLSLFEKLTEERPLTPLTGEDNEWEYIPMLKDGDEMVGLQQNKRCNWVYKHRGIAKDYQAILYHSTSRGLSYYDKTSQKEITFPYLPVTEVVEVG